MKIGYVERKKEWIIEKSDFLEKATNAVITKSADNNNQHRANSERRDKSYSCCFDSDTNHRSMNGT